MKKLDIYEALISDSQDGLVCVSIVDEPATEKDFVLFSKAKQSFAVISDEKRLLSSVIMVCDTPIYRRDNSGYEYYIKYGAETIRKMAQKMLSDGTFNTFDFQHNGERLEKGKIQLVELYIKDEEKGLNPNFIDVPNGSLMATYKIEDDEIWELVKSGEYKGLSLEGYFTIEKEKLSKKQKNTSIMNINKIKDVLRSLLVEASNMMTDKGNLFYDGELVEGVAVFSDEEMETVAEDGDYETDTQVISIENGSVKEIKDKEIPEEEPTETEEPKEEEVEAEEETVEETPTEEPKEEETVEDDKIAELLARIEALEAKVAELETKLMEPVTEPIAEEFSKVKDTPSNKWERYAEMIRNSKM